MTRRQKQEPFKQVSQITQESYDKVIKELKRERRKVRKINRERFNGERQKAAENAVEREYAQRYHNLEEDYYKLNQKYKYLKEALSFYKNISKCSFAITLGVCVLELIF